MIVVKTFVSELNKKIDALKIQIDQFEDKVDSVNYIVKLLEKRSLKKIDSINGDDIALLDEDEFKYILEIMKYGDLESCLEKFITNSINLRLYAKLLLDGNSVSEDEEHAAASKEWLDKQANQIKEFINEFKNDNENYLNSLKTSDNLYKKYLSYFESDELIKPITDLEEFNDVLKKCGLITNEKWQLLKYIAKKNIELVKYDDSKEFLHEIKALLDSESEVINSVDKNRVGFYKSVFGMTDNELKKYDLNNDELIKYQQISLLYNIKSLYDEVSKKIKANLTKEELKKLEEQKKELKAYKDSYEFFKKIN